MGHYDKTKKTYTVDPSDNKTDAETDALYCALLAYMEAYTARDLLDVLDELELTESLIDELGDEAAMEREGR